MNGQSGGATAAMNVSRRALWFRWTLANATGWGIGGIAGRITAVLIGTTVGETWETVAAALRRGGGPGSLLFAGGAAMIVVLAMGAGSVAVGAVVGLMQARVLGPHLRSRVHWVAATIEGTTAGVLVGVTLARLVQLALPLVVESAHRAVSQPFMARLVTMHGAHDLAWMITGGAIGLFVGNAQRLALSIERGRAAAWILASLAGWSLAGLAASASAAPATLNEGFASGWELRRIVNNLAGLVIFGLVGGAVGGGITGTVLGRLLRTADK